MKTLNIAVITFLTLAAAGASAQSSKGLQRVDVQGRAQPMRVACPEIENQLQLRLGRQWRQLQVGGEFRVDFSLVNGEVGEIHIEGRPRHYVSEIRRTLRSLDCSGHHPVRRTSQCNCACWTKSRCAMATRLPC